MMYMSLIRYALMIVGTFMRSLCTYVYAFPIAQPRLKNRFVLSKNKPYFPQISLSHSKACFSLTLPRMQCKSRQLIHTLSYSECAISFDYSSDSRRLTLVPRIHTMLHLSIHSAGSGVEG